MTEEHNGSIMIAMLWMLLLSILLFWLPLFGGLIAGFIGGQKAGSISAAIIAVFLPALLLGGLLFVFTSLVSGLPIIGMLAAFGGLTFALAGISPLLLGAIVGGATSD